MSLHRLSDEDVARFREALLEQQARHERETTGRPGDDDGDDGAMRMFAWVVLIGVVVLMAMAFVVVGLQLLEGGR